MPRFQKQLVWAELSDAKGSNATGYANGVFQDGPLVGIDISSYNVSGSRLDKIGNGGFRLPLDMRRNLGAGVGSQIKFYEGGTPLDPATLRPAPIAHFVIGDKSEKVTDDGLWAEFQCPDVIQELVDANIGGGCAFGLQDTVQSGLSAIVGRQTETPWIASNYISGYDGMSFSANFTSSFETISKFIGAMNGHFTRGPGNGGREVVVSNFGTQIPIVFQRPSKIAGRRNSSVRFISNLDVSVGSKIVNDITPSGAGNGITALTLGELAPVDAAGNPQLNAQFASGAIPGYNPAYPIKARKRLDNGGLDGYDYYIEDAASVIAYRRKAAGMSRTDIGPISAASTDKLFAAASLYIATVTALKKMAQPRTTIKVTTYAYPGLDNRWFAGYKVLVRYQRVNALGANIINLNDWFYVVDVTRRITDGRMYDEWQLSSDAEWEDSGLNSVVVGATQAIDSIRVAPQIYPAESNIWFAEDIGPNGGDIVVHIPGSKAYVRSISAMFNFYLQPLRGTVGATGNGAHAHITPIDAQQVPEPSHVTTTPNHSHGFAGKTTGTIWQKPDTAAAFNPTAKLNISPKGSSGGYALYQPTRSDQGWLWAEGGYSDLLPVSTAILYWADIAHSHDLNGTSTDSNSGGVTAAQNVQTTPPTALTTAKQGFGDKTTKIGAYNGLPTAGGDHTHDQTYTLINVGVAPVGVQILIDNIVVVAKSSNPGSFLGLDFNAYFNNQLDHTLVVRSDTIGRVQGTGTIRRHVTTVAV